MERIKEEEQHNKRRPQRIKFQYTHILQNGRLKEQNFTLPLVANDEGELRGLDVGVIFRAAITEAVDKNPYFYRNTPQITSMALSVPQFRNFEVFYQDGLHDIAVGVLRDIGGFPEEFAKLQLNYAGN